MLLLGRLAPGPNGWVLGLWGISLAVMVTLAVMSLRSLIVGSDRPRLDGEIFLPMVTAPLVVSLTASEIGFGGAGVAPLWIAATLWPLLVALLSASLAIAGSPSRIKLPTLAIPSGSPALAGSAWFAFNGRVVDFGAVSLAGLALVAVVVQLGAVLKYAKLSWSPAFWAFTFPAAAVVGFCASLAHIAGSAGGVVVAWVGIGLLTAFVVSLIGSPYASAGRDRLRRRHMR